MSYDVREQWYGRAVSLDERDQNYLVHPPLERAREVSYRFWSCGQPLDQGPLPQCVAYAGFQFLQAGPVRNLQHLPTPPALYAAAQDADEWPGNDYPGTSVRALFKVLAARGYVDRYEWAFELEPAIAHILTTGPVVLGTNWYSGMDEPDRNGFLHVDGDVLGGHAYLAIGANRTRKCPDGSIGAVRIMNSWGRDWADKGRAWISFADLGRLIADEWGEACTANEIKLVQR